MSKRKGTAYAIAVFAIVAHVFVIPPQVSAAPSPSSMSLVHLAPSDARQFQRAMASLASQAHVALVAEGVPLKPALSAAEAVNLTAEMPLDQAVSKMAAAYDYDAQRQGSVFVLIKRYSDSHDLPCVTLAECQRAADDLSDVLNVFNPLRERPRWPTRGCGQLLRVTFAGTASISAKQNTLLWKFIAQPAGDYSETFSLSIRAIAFG